VRKQLWLWPLLAAAMLWAAFFWIRSSVEEAARAELAKSLTTIRNADVAALNIWMTNHKQEAGNLAGDTRVRKLAAELARDAAHVTADDVAPLLQAESQAELRPLLRTLAAERQYAGFALLEKGGTVLSSDRQELIGTHAPPKFMHLLEKTLAAGPTVSHPFPSSVQLRDESRELRSGIPTMFAAAPVLDPTGDPVGALFLRIKPEVEFTKILQVAKSGETGETYAFDKSGLLLSESRFNGDLVRAGLLPDQPNVRSILNIQILDPGVDMVAGYRPTESRADQPLTTMAASATQGREGVNVEGYRDYRGVSVVGAWTWLPEYEFGVATEIDVAEAYGPIYILRRAFWGLFGLLAASAAVILMFSIGMARLHRVAQKATLAARELGQYQLEEKLGEGGMGVVYRGRHKMLRRPTAIKLLHPDKTTDDAIARFEREVQLSCQLNHPNTVAIYDYGRTSEGLFYYAMEYLEGIDLETLVARHGRLREGRVIHILTQICGSLAEAHGVGLVHRDIKPANLMICRRGGTADHVKVLDFGLVKAVDSQTNAITASNVVMGTPNYMSPESFDQPERVDARSDIYAVAAVGYFLLTGQPPFSGQTALEICMQHVRTPPERPADRIKLQLADDLQQVILKGLAKKPEDRFASALEFAEALTGCESAGSWTTRQAIGWWEAHAAGLTGTQHVPVGGVTVTATIHQAATMEMAK
jgi:hypothetical protein